MTGNKPVKANPERNRNISRLNAGKTSWLTVALFAFAIALVFAATYGIILMTEQRTHSSAEKLVSDVVTRVNSKMLDVENAARKEVLTVNAHMDDPDALEKLIYDFVEDNDFVYGSTVAFEPNAFPDYGYSFAPYSWKDGDGIHSRQLGEETDFYREEWYAETKESLNEYWCEPYFDEGGAKIMMCTFSLPIVDENGRLAAVLTADVGLEDLEEYITSISPSPESFILLRSEKGAALVNADRDTASGNDRVIIKGLTDIGWSVELSMPFAYLMRGDTGMAFTIGTILFFTVLLVYFINFLISKAQQRASAEYMHVIEEQSAFTAFFLEPYTSAYYVGLDDLSVQVYKRTSNLEKEYPVIANYVEALRTYIEKEVHPDDRNDFLDLIRPEKMKEMLAARPEFSYTFRIISDSTKYISFQAIRGADENHAAFGFVDVTEDILAQQAHQQKLQEALNMAQSANKAKTEFLFNMSHDIRTPMNAILGYTDIAIRHAGDADKVNESLKKIKVSGGHLLSLINDILEMSRIEAGALEIVNEPVDIMAAIEGVDLMSRALAVPKSIDYSTTVGRISNQYIYADELHVNQIIINLISNAVKYTERGGKVEYLVSQLSDPVDGIAKYRVVVKDTGIGMSEEFQKHLFESFSRERNATVSKLEGAGLGLSIAKRITDLVGGTIEVRSAKGEGSTFSVTLPFKVMDEDAIAGFKAEHAEKTNSTSPVLEGKKVLVVEDNEMNREIATEILEETGLIVETAEDGGIAVEKIAGKGADYYDFILMDIQMPVMNGYEATRAIRALPDGQKIPIIALSANAFEEDRQKSLDAGMNGHVAKPVNVKELLDVMANFRQ